MTENEKTELEFYIDMVDSLIGDFYVVATQNNISLDKDDNVSRYYKKMLKYARHLRGATSYKDVLDAKKNIDAIKQKLAKLEVCGDV